MVLKEMVTEELKIAYESIRINLRDSVKTEEEKFVENYFWNAEKSRKVYGEQLDQNPRDP